MKSSSPRNIVRLLIVLSTVLGLCVAPTLSASATAATTYVAAPHAISASWSGPTTVEAPVGGLNGVSCVNSALWCQAVDAHGAVATLSSGTWSTPTVIATGVHLSSISCTSPGACVAVGSGGKALVETAGNWSNPTVIDAPHDLASVSCATSTFCVAVDAKGNAVTFNGGGWSSPQSISTHLLSSVSCPTSTFCTAVGENGTVVSFSSGSWGASHTVDTGLGNLLMSVSCPAANNCVAIDLLGTIVQDIAGTWVTISYSLTGIGTNQVSCSTTSLCVVLDGSGDIGHYVGASWHDTTTVGAPQPSAMSCSGTNCIVVDHTGVSFLISNSGSTASGPSPTFDPSSSLNAITCPTPTFCAAVAANGELASFNGTAWSQPQQVTTELGGINSISCATPTACIALTSSNKILTRDGTTWSIRTLASLGIDPTQVSPTNVTCQDHNAAKCYVVFDNFSEFNVNLASPGGPSYHSLGSIGGVPQSALFPTTLACSAAGCLMTDDQGGAYWGNTRTSNGHLVYTGQFDAAGYPQTESCASDLAANTTCVVSDDQGDVYTATIPVGQIKPTKWTKAHITAGSVNATTCVTAVRCLAADSNGTVFTESDGTWNANQSVDTAGSVRDIGCLTAVSCVVIDDSAAYVESVATATTTTSISVPSHGAASQPLTVKATVSSDSAPTGDVTFSALGYACTAALVAISPTQAVAQCQVGFTVGGVVTTTATYNGDYGYSGSKAAAHTTVTKTKTTTKLQVSRASYPAGHGNLEHVVVSITSAYHTQGMTGVVLVKTGSLVLCSLASKGVPVVCSPKPSALGVGTHSLVAIYSGSSAYLGSVSASVVIKVTAH